jgi:hypothetical protein
MRVFLWLMCGCCVEGWGGKWVSEFFLFFLSLEGVCLFFCSWEGVLIFFMAGEYDNNRKMERDGDETQKGERGIPSKGGGGRKKK